jgi:hypothetical protein
MTVETDATTPAALSAGRLFSGAARARRSAALVFGDVMTVLETDVAAPVLSAVRLFSGATTLRAALAAAVRGDSSGYGCGLA